MVILDWVKSKIKVNNKLKKNFSFEIGDIIKYNKNGIYTNIDILDNPEDLIEFEETVSIDL